MSTKQNDQIIDFIKDKYDDVDLVNDQNAQREAEEEFNIRMSIEEDRS